MGDAVHGRSNAIHFSVGCVNSIPVPVCGSFEAYGITYTRTRVELVDCRHCRRVLENCGVSINGTAKQREQRDKDDDEVVTYALPSFLTRALEQ